jgi:hypothetical protein
MYNNQVFDFLKTVIIYQNYVCAFLVVTGTYQNQVFDLLKPQLSTLIPGLVPRVWFNSCPSERDDSLDQLFCEF